MGAVTFRYYCVFHDTNKASYDRGRTSRCGWTEKAPRPLAGTNLPPLALTGAPGHKSGKVAPGCIKPPSNLRLARTTSLAP